MKLDQVVDTSLLEAGVSAETPLVIGVSGGADSLALLHAIAQRHAASRLLVAHLHHGMRDSAEYDAAFVERTAQAWGIRCVIGRADVPAQARQTGDSLEAAARVARYRFLAATAATFGATYVAVGHTADDQAETVLLHLVRGSGLQGLGGMSPSGAWPLSGYPHLRLLRPLLSTSRAAVEMYCAAHALQPVEDETNRDVTYRRNFVRHQVLPLLRTVNPQITQRLAALADVVSAELTLLDAVEAELWTRLLREQTATRVQLSRTEWQTLLLGMQRRLLRRAITTLEPDATELSLSMVDAALAIVHGGNVGSQAQLPAGLVLEVGYDAVIVRRHGSDLPASGPQLRAEHSVDLPVPGLVALQNGRVLRAEAVGDAVRSRVADASDAASVYVELGPDERLQVRPRQVGERMQPLGMGGRSRKLQDVMVDAKLPAAERPLWPVVATESRVVWVVGVRLDERSAVSTEPQPSARLVHLTCFAPSGAT